MRTKAKWIITLVVLVGLAIACGNSRNTPANDDSLTTDTEFYVNDDVQLADPAPQQVVLPNSSRIAIQIGRLQERMSVLDKQRQELGEAINQLASQLEEAIKEEQSTSDPD